MKTIIKALACAAFLAATPAAATNILDNPGFETGTLSPWYVGDNVSGGTVWSVTDADSHSGTYSAEDTGNIELRQDFAGVLGSSIGEVSFWAEHPIQGTNADLAFDFYYSDSTSAEFLVDLSGTDWNFFNVTAQLDPTKTLTGFSIFGNGTGDNPVTRADDFTIDVPSVPEPATWAMMILGFGLTGFAMRRRRRVSAALA